MKMINQESSVKIHLPGVKAHLEGGKSKKIHLPGVKAHLEGVLMEGGKPKKILRLHLGGVRLSNGFTLVEILVVMAIVAIVGMMIVVIFTNTLRGSNKSQILASIKQNGQAVLENMDKTIRNADNVVCLSNTGDTLVVDKNGAYARYRFIAPSPSPVPTANGLIQQDSPTKNATETDAEFIRRACTDPMSLAQILTDTNSQSGVSVASGSFTRNIQSGFKDNVTVQFTLGPGVGAPTVTTGQIDPVTFQTTVQLR